MRVSGIRLPIGRGWAVKPLTIMPYPSPNFGARNGGQPVSLVVLHYTAMGSVEAALDRLCDPDCEVSAHYVIAQDGRVFQLVEESARAWHAGAGAWAGAGDVNSRSIGIELDNDGAGPFADPVMGALEGLLADIMKRHGLPPKAVIGHADMAPDRKGDPGPYFDWKRLAQLGLSVWPTPHTPGDFLADAAQFGYPEEAGEGPVLEAFRQRFRPFATGPLCDEDRSLMAGLAAEFPAKG